MVVEIRYHDALYVFNSPKTDPLTSGAATLALVDKIRNEASTFYDFLDRMIKDGFKAQHYIVYDYSDGGVVREG